MDGRSNTGGGFAGVVSYHIRELEDVPGVVELFRMNYERAKASAERREERTERKRNSDDEQDRRDSGRHIERSVG